MFEGSVMDPCWDNNLSYCDYIKPLSLQNNPSFPKKTQETGRRDFRSLWEMFKCIKYLSDEGEGGFDYAGNAKDRILESNLLTKKDKQNLISLLNLTKDSKGNLELLVKISDSILKNRAYIDVYRQDIVQNYLIFLKDLTLTGFSESDFKIKGTFCSIFVTATVKIEEKEGFFMRMNVKFTARVVSKGTLVKELVTKNIYSPDELYNVFYSLNYIGLKGCFPVKNQVGKNLFGLTFLHSIRLNEIIDSCGPSFLYHESELFKGKALVMDGGSKLTGTLLSSIATIYLIKILGEKAQIVLSLILITFIILMLIYHLIENLNKLTLKLIIYNIIKVVTLGFLNDKVCVYFKRRMLGISFCNLRTGVPTRMFTDRIVLYPSRKSFNHFEQDDCDFLVGETFSNCKFSIGMSEVEIEELGKRNKIKLTWSFSGSTPIIEEFKMGGQKQKDCLLQIFREMESGKVDGFMSRYDEHFGVVYSHYMNPMEIAKEIKEYGNETILILRSTNERMFFSGSRCQPVNSGFYKRMCEKLGTETFNAILYHWSMFFNDPETGKTKEDRDPLMVSILEPGSKINTKALPLGNKEAKKYCSDLTKIYKKMGKKPLYNLTILKDSASLSSVFKSLDNGTLDEDFSVILQGLNKSEIKINYELVKVDVIKPKIDLSLEVEFLSILQKKYVEKTSEIDSEIESFESLKEIERSKKEETKFQQNLKSSILIRKWGMESLHKEMSRLEESLSLKKMKNKSFKLPVLKIDGEKYTVSLNGVNKMKIPMKIILGEINYVKKIKRTGDREAGSHKKKKPNVFQYKIANLGVYETTECFRIFHDSKDGTDRRLPVGKKKFLKHLNGIGVKMNRICSLFIKKCFLISRSYILKNLAKEKGLEVSTETQESDEIDKMTKKVNWMIDELKEFCKDRGINIREKVKEDKMKYH